jgi:hypothetical protein
MITADSIVFNPLKHYLPYIRSFVKTSIENFDPSAVCNQLKLIGESQMDLYTGTLEVKNIFFQTIAFLHVAKVNDYQGFLDWIKNQDEFASYKLSDHSLWILRRGIDEKKFIHIHPGRHSTNTIRIKSGVLKSAIASIIWSTYYNKKLSLSVVNEARIKLCYLPPIKALKQEEGILKIIDLINSFPSHGV